MSGVYREKATVPPEPPYASLLSPRRHQRCGPAPDLRRGPTWTTPLWNQLELDAGSVAPAPPGPRPRSWLGTFSVVVVVGFAVAALGQLALSGYRRYLFAARTGESRAMLASIAKAEEAYRQDHLTYLGCSRCSGTECAPHIEAVTPRFYPHDRPSQHAWLWDGADHPDAHCWATLRVATSSPVRYVYAVISGLPGEAPPFVPGLSTQPAWPSTTTEPWYVVEALGDADGDGIMSISVRSSFRSEILVENEGE